ncbi:MAG: calcium/sodium antiporter [bacterium]|nr:calcium/sodium antiporter [bacterium]
MLAQAAIAWSQEHPTIAVMAGLVMLVVGAELLVRGAVWIALVLGMSRMAVGLTLVAIGTSLPELLVSLTAAKKGNDDVALTNVLGSNVANVWLIVGTAAAICAIRLKVRWFELTYLLIATALLAVPFLVGCGIEPVTSSLMLAMLVVFCTQLLLRERRDRKTAPPDKNKPIPTPVGWVTHVGLFIGGFFGLSYGAEWLVDGAIVVAENLGLDPGLAGFIIIAIGTSLPELATSVVAALRRQPEICIGNVLGSNIFNVGAVLGTAGMLQPFEIDGKSTFPMIATAVSTLMLIVMLRLCTGVPRWAGWLFLALYAGTLAALVAMRPGGS